MSLRRFVTTFLAGSVVASGAAQQKKQSEPNELSSLPPDVSSPMVLKVTTHLVIVDAVVLDSSGLPVRDLKKEDFGLYEDGKRQDIQVFSFEGGGRTTKLPQDLPPAGTNTYFFNDAAATGIYTLSLLLALPAAD